MRFLLQFRGVHKDLRIHEFYAALATVRNVHESQLHINLTSAYASLTGVPTPIQPTHGDAGAVLYGEIFFYADLRSEAEAIALSKYTVLLRAVYLPIAHGASYPACVDASKRAAHCSALQPLRDIDRKPSFRCYVDAFGSKIAVDKQLEKIHQFGHLLQTFPGPVRMKNPDYELWILEDDFPRRGHGRREGSDGPRQVFLARKVAAGQAFVRASYSLKTRCYIGPTSMDAELSFVMATMARVRPGHLVNDPFCGTGGVLVACAARGALCVGSDINILALRGKGSSRNVLANFDQYNLTRPIGLLRADVLNSPIRSGGEGLFDAVICDPPYGIKEGTRVFREDAIDASLEGSHFQGTERVAFVDFLHGVLQYAAEVLVLGGRLVYWLPTTVDYCEDDVPSHPALKIVHNGEQPLTLRMSRRLITMQRVEGDIGDVKKARPLSEVQTVGGGEARRPAHFDLACKLMRQPERAEGRLRRRDGVS